MSTVGAGRTGSTITGVWRNLVGADIRVVHTGSERADLAASLVADRRLTAARYPTDQREHRLVGEPAEHIPRFAELWRSGEAPPHREPRRRKTIEHPAVGRVTLDCDTLIVATDDVGFIIGLIPPTFLAAFPAHPIGTIPVGRRAK